jgi:hypothetical protein
MNRLAIANELVRLAEDIVAIEFPSEEAMRKYLNEHPLANQSNHTVKKSEGDKLREKVYDIHHASKLVKVAKDLTAGNPPKEAYIDGNGRWAFRLPHVNFGTLVEGSKPWWEAQEYLKKYLANQISYHIGHWAGDHEIRQIEDLLALTKLRGN